MAQLRVMQITLPAKGFEKITVSNAAAGKGVTVASIGEACLLSVEGANIRYRLDGTAPDTDTGHLLYAGQQLYLHCKNAIQNLLMIRDADTDATLQVTHF